jgi:hypothetical protein
VSAEVRARVLAVHDMEVLGRWFATAVTAGSVDAFVAGLG